MVTEAEVESARREWEEGHRRLLEQAQDAATGNRPLAQVDGHRAAQIGAARLDPHQPAPVEHALQPANSSFDFGEFRHCGCMAKRPHPR